MDPLSLSTPEVRTCDCNASRESTEVRTWNTSKRIASIRPAWSWTRRNSEESGVGDTVDRDGPARLFDAGLREMEMDFGYLDVFGTWALSLDIGPLTEHMPY